MDEVRRADQLEAVQSVTGGMLVADVAKELGVTEAVVYRWCEDKGILKSLRQQKYDALVEEYQTNTDLTIAQLLAKHGVAQNTLYRILAQRGVPNRRSQGPSDEDSAALVVKLFDAGVVIVQIQHRTKKGFPFIYRALDAAGRDRRRR